MSESELPGHVQETIDPVAELRAQAQRNATPQQRAIEWLTKRLARPPIVYVVLAFCAVWIVGNIVVKATGHHPIDTYPFPALSGLVSLAALVMTILILTTDTRLAAVSDERARLTLQMDILTERKVAKTIELLEEMRRDDPHMRDRDDAEAGAMTEAVDPRAVLRAIDDAHDKLAQE